MKRLSELRALLASNRVTLSAMADDTGVILDLATQQVVALNEAGLYLAGRLRESELTVDDLVNAMMRRFAVDEETAARDLESFVEDLTRRLTECGHEPP